MSAEPSDHARQLITYIELEGIKQQHDQVDSFGKPLDHHIKIVMALDALFLSTEDAWRVYQTEMF